VIAQSRASSRIVTEAKAFDLVNMAHVQGKSISGHDHLLNDVLDVPLGKHFG
jgi:hypothetical protein